LLKKISVSRYATYLSDRKGEGESNSRANGKGETCKYRSGGNSGHTSYGHEWELLTGKQACQEQG
jgi:hypothetical protein